MGLNGWGAPPGNVLLNGAPQPRSIGVLFEIFNVADGLKLEALCDYVFQINGAFTPTLVQGATLRALVYFMMGSLLGFWEKRKITLPPFKGVCHVHDRLCSGLIRVGLVDNTPGAAERWCDVHGALVKARFQQANLKLLALPGGPDGYSSVVEGQRTLASAFIDLKVSTERSVTALRAELVRVGDELEAAEATLARMAARPTSLPRSRAASTSTSTSTSSGITNSSGSSSSGSSGSSSVGAVARAEGAQQQGGGSAEEMEEGEFEDDEGDTAPLLRQQAPAVRSRGVFGVSFPSRRGLLSVFGGAPKPSIQNSPLAGKVTMDTKLTVGAAMARLAEHHIEAAQDLQIHTNFGYNQQGAIRKVDAYMRAVATPEELAVWTAAFLSSVRVAPAPVLAAAAPVADAAGGGGGGISAPASPSSLLVLFLKLEARVKYRFDIEEIALLGKKSNAGPLTIHSLTGRVTPLTKVDPTWPARMKSTPEDLAAFIVEAEKPAPKKTPFAAKRRRA